MFIKITVTKAVKAEVFKQWRQVRIKVQRLNRKLL